jgi:hypothetical protein
MSMSRWIPSTQSIYSYSLVTVMGHHLLMSSNINYSYGGLGGGGDGSSNYIENINYKGAPNTGSGGGGYINRGYSGGSGVVLLRYLSTREKVRVSEQSRF